MGFRLEKLLVNVHSLQPMAKLVSLPGSKPLSAVAAVCGRQTSGGRIEFLSELLHCITSVVLLTSESV